MRESNVLFREEQRIVDISRRLNEQNEYFEALESAVEGNANKDSSQLLELLHDLNRCPQITSRLRDDLQPSGTRLQKSRLVSESETADEHAAALTKLREAKLGLRKGEVALSEYRRLEEEILQSAVFTPQKAYSALKEELHKSHSMIVQDPQSHQGSPGDFLSSQQEEQYLQALDVGCDLSQAARVFPPLSSLRSGMALAERDRDNMVRNPVSVYNWLRKHQPQVFLQDNEASSERTQKVPASRNSKRASATIKQEEEFYDEDGVAIFPKDSIRIKRKRDDDGGYRPKGGNSRPSKRKKDDGGSNVGKGKRPSILGLDT